MTINTKTQNSSIIREALKIAKRSNVPMSLDEIRGKFQVEFPFQVKKVVDAGQKTNYRILVGETRWVSDFSSDIDGWYAIQHEGHTLNTPNNLKQWVLI